MDPFLQQLAELCGTQITRNKWVFVPSHAIGRTLGERLTLHGTPWLNLRFVTPLDIALRMGAPFLVERHIDPSEEGLGPALMMRLLLDVKTEPGYFRPLADQPTLAQALWSTVRELRMAGVRAVTLPADGFGTPAKRAEVVALLAGYERYLSDQGRADMAAVYEEALTHLEWCPIGPADCWTTVPATVWAPLQERLLEAVPGERVTPRTVGVPGAAVPRRLTSAREDRVAPDASAGRLSFLLRPGESVNAHRVDTPASPALSLFHAGGREAEVDEVIRRILQAGGPLDEVEVACGSDAHVSLFWEKALRHEWPVTLGPGIAAAATRPGRALIALCDWVETDFSAPHLRQLLQSGDVAFDREVVGFSAGQAAGILARAEAGWGRATYALSLGALHRNYESRAQDPDSSEDDRAYAANRAVVVAAVKAWLTELLGTLPLDGGAGVPLQEVVTCVLGYLEKAAARASQLDHRAAAALTTHISDLRALGSFRCGLPQALRFIRERVLTARLASERPRPGFLHVASLSQAGQSGRRRLFVVGMEEGRVFATGTEDPILLDHERAAISPALRRSGDAIEEAVWTTLLRLATCSAETVTISYSCRDTREFRETYASWLMLQAFRLEQRNPSLNYSAMRQRLGEPVSRVPAPREAATSRGGWWLRSMGGTGSRGIAVVESAFAGTARGRTATAARSGKQFSEFDGFVPEAGPILDPCLPSTVLSVTDLEGAAACPFRFFLKRGLGLRPLDGRTRDKDLWLDPLTRGSLLHDIYAALWRRCRDADRRPSPKSDGKWLTALVEQHLVDLNAEMPAATAEILDRESRDLHEDVRLFLESEAADLGRTPLAFEVSFGRPLGEHEEKLASPAPVTIPLGKGLSIRVAGRIDRIDQIAPGTFEILDYKTGTFWSKAWRGTFDGGRRLQHALYGLAAVQLLKRRHASATVVRATYYFPSRKGRQERVHIPTPSLAATARVLNDVRRVIASGAFVHTAEGDNCRYCDYTDACGTEATVHAAAKAGDTGLAAYVELTSHE